MSDMNKNNITAYLHCKLCIKEWKKLKGISPSEYQKISVGWTEKGLQVWCERHEVNIMHIDFEGKKHPADLTRAASKGIVTLNITAERDD